MLKALIFDVDGTLAETEEYHRRAFNRTFFEAGLDWYWDEALYRDLLKVTGGKERIAHFIAQHAPEARDAAPPFEPHLLAPRLHARKTEIYLDFMEEDGIPLRPGMAELIAEAVAAGLVLAIATTTNLPNVEGLLSKAIGADWRKIFPVVIAGDMVALKKPAPDVYLGALDALGLPATACLALEDSANGVASARAAGLQVIGLRSAYLPFDDLTGALEIFPVNQTPNLARITAR